jgi:hypothetical protein
MNSKISINSRIRVPLSKIYDAFDIKIKNTKDEIKLNAIIKLRDGIENQIYDFSEKYKDSLLSFNHGQYPEPYKGTDYFDIWYFVPMATQIKIMNEDAYDFWVGTFDPADESVHNSIASLTNMITCRLDQFAYFLIWKGRKNDDGSDIKNYFCNIYITDIHHKAREALKKIYIPAIKELHENYKNEMEQIRLNSSPKNKNISPKNKNINNNQVVVTIENSKENTNESNNLFSTFEQNNEIELDSVPVNVQLNQVDIQILEDNNEKIQSNNKKLSVDDFYSICKQEMIEHNNISEENQLSEEIGEEHIRDILNDKFKKITGKLQYSIKEFDTLFGKMPVVCVHLATNDGTFIAVPVTNFITNMNNPINFM